MRGLWALALAGLVSACQGKELLPAEGEEHREGGATSILCLSVRREGNGWVRPRGSRAGHGHTVSCARSPRARSGAVAAD